MFNSEFELNFYVENRTHIPNAKPYLKYYIDKKLYDLFTYAIIFKNSYEIEFFTINSNYKDIWNKLKIYNDYGRTSLIDCEYDKNYHCYTVSVFCPDLLRYLKSMHDYSFEMSEYTWKEKAKDCNWSQYDIDMGYFHYKLNCINWFERHYGKHITGLGWSSFIKEYDKQMQEKYK